MLAKEKNEKKSFHENKYWWMFLTSIILLFVAQAITFVFYKWINSDNPLITLDKIDWPSIIAVFCSIVIMIVYIWLTWKEISYQQFHYQKKWLGLIFLSLIIYFLYLILIICFVPIFNSKIDYKNDDIFNQYKWCLIIYLVVGGVLSLVTIALHKYCFYKIALEIYQRMYGKQSINQSKINQQNIVKKEQKEKNKPTTGLLDQSTTDDETI